MRRHRVGLNISRTTLPTLREGASYMQFEHKLQSLHLAGVDIGSMNHSREFIRGFVDSMTYVMDGRIKDHVRAIDPITGREPLNHILQWMIKGGVPDVPHIDVV